MRNIIKHPFINLIFFVALFAFSGCTNEMEPDIAGNSNLPADGTPLTVRATASGFQAPAQPGSSPATRTPVMEATSTKFQTGDAIGSSACAKTHLALNTYQRTSTTSR